MIQIVTNVVRVRCGVSADTRTGFCRIDKPTWELGATGAAFIKKVREHLKRCVREGYDREQVAPVALLQEISVYLCSKLLVRLQAQPAPVNVAFGYKEVSSMMHAKTEYLWDAKRCVFHLQRKRYVALCGHFWLRGAYKHLMGAFVKRDDVPDALCPECREVEEQK